MIAATHGTQYTAFVTGPLGETVMANWGMSGDGSTAFIEMAAASGLALVPPEKRNPLITTLLHRRADPACAGARRQKHYHRHWRQRDQ